jgi:hypothetical protein
LYSKSSFGVTTHCLARKPAKRSNAGNRPCRAALAYFVTDIKRAIKGARAAGMEVARVEINKDGVIVVVPSKPEKPVDERSETNEWDSVA